MKFTQEIKDKWLEALKSGKFIQIDGQLELDGKYCCIGVLGEIHPELNNNVTIGSTCPYTYLKNTVGNDATNKLWQTNDNTFDPEKPDYSNVIPLIESLPVQE